MSMKLYVGNLSFDTSSNELQTLFAQAGTVESVSLIEDRETGRSRGFGFVEMSKTPIRVSIRQQVRTCAKGFPETAKPLFIGSIPIAASKPFNNSRVYGSGSGR